MLNPMITYRKKPIFSKIGRDHQRMACSGEEGGEKNNQRPEMGYQKFVGMTHIPGYHMTITGDELEKTNQGMKPI